MTIPFKPGLDKKELNILRKANFHQHAHDVSCIRMYAHNLASHFVCCIDEREKDSFAICEQIQAFCEKLHLNLAENLKEEMNEEEIKAEKKEYYH